MESRFPEVNGRYQITSEWSIYLENRYLKRFEEDNLVFWKKGLTIYIAIWDLYKNSKQETLKWIKEDSCQKPIEKYEFVRDRYLYYGYLLEEDIDNNKRWALYVFTIANSGYVQMAIYFDNKEELEVAKDIWSTLEEK